MIVLRLSSREVSRDVRSTRACVSLGSGLGADIQEADLGWASEEAVLFHRGTEIELHRPDGKGDIAGSETELWRYDETPDVPCPLYVDGLVYLVHDKGFLHCLDAKSGQPPESFRASAAVLGCVFVERGRLLERSPSFSDAP